MIKIKLSDGTEKKVKEGITVFELVSEIDSKLSTSCIGAIITQKDNSTLIDNITPINFNCSIKFITNQNNEAYEIIRHSCAHLLAHAVSELFPYAKTTIGPTTHNGFYYDFDHEPFSEEDLKKIEIKMKEIAKSNLEIKREEISKKEALELFKDNEFKIEIIKELPENEPITIYKQGDWFDLCRGPHIQNTRKLVGFKLDKSTGAYWRGDSKNKQLQRIYGFAFFDKKELNTYLLELEQAKKRDHKKIAKDLNLYMIDELVGKGLPMWLPKGQILKNEIEKLANEIENEENYLQVSTPHLAKEELFLKSGHLPHYKEGMYPSMEMDDGTYYLKAMNCPFHHLIFSHKPKSYKELPIKLAEYGTCYRNELSGALSGLLRVRMLSMNDAHIYCTKNQIEAEIKKVILMVKKYYELFKFENYYFRLSTWDSKNKEKYIDEPKNWNYTQKILRNILKKLKVEYTEVSDEAAFYGPKIDIQFKTVLGREETMSTIQLDFAAKKKFDLKYTDKNGELNNEVFVIHRAPLSTHERFSAFLIEHYEGRFPLWLNPNQIKICPVSDIFLKYSQKIYKKIKKLDFRVELDKTSDGISKKIRNAQLEKYNYMIVIGEKEIESKTITIRDRTGKNNSNIELKEFLKSIKKEREFRE
ncbi:threonine--tRNA ligase [Candidatus Woesearchaeota archaeon]|jgi:threonyl-tRNA synthetase|nr:threonine--tRNA ligase [Candidatus Woesearchaeota archaeon]MBT4387718.1 threonine--tRNA ligase [Candidatus Woesearchaeota archaeon]MBT4595537.1 threonine--tRNA ligase [Candidatus Woesearchaeota archaeon]MBT5740980.1 threonine--tRNA ligase [Candidatus Woesearchaeota archaeon]MBT6505836.1 threonine--tRNA ligase [Candidatus Woesearchaeota archaeon]